MDHLLSFSPSQMVKTACSVLGQREVQANDGERCAAVRLPNAKLALALLALLSTLSLRNTFLILKY